MKILKIYFVVAACLYTCMSVAQERDNKAIDEAVKGWWTASMKTHEQRVQWWRDARFGMFIHWGIYSLPGGEWKGKKVSGYAEHLMRKERIPRSEYLELAHRFNPTRFNADQWALDAKKAGMKYMIITSKHHDGFAMYNSAVSDFNIVKQTPFKRDPMAELSAACKKQGIKFGFYYSHAFDWEYPKAPGNDWEYKNPGGDSNLFGGVNWYDVHPELLPKAQQYVDEKAIPQIKELIRKYHPDILWFDTPSKLPLSENIRILKAIREVDLNVVVNGRLVRSPNANFGDYKNTADRPAEFYPVTGDWEAIPTTNESYGYHQFDSSHKPVSFFVQLLAKAASRGGNLLMNIGPKGDGTFDTRDLTILHGIGKWMDKNGESIYRTTAGPLPLQNWGVCTRKGNRLYLHVINWPTGGKLFVGGLKSNPSNIYLLANAAKPLTSTRINDKDIAITIPSKAPDSMNTVIVLDFKESPQIDSIPFIAPGIQETRLLAFGATQHGKGLSYGDGKTDRFYVENWKSKDQWLSWKFRTTANGMYSVSIKYIATENSGGAFELKVGPNSIVVNVQDKGQGIKPITDWLDTISLDKGEHELIIRPVSIDKSELMKLLEVQLSVVEPKN